MRSLAIIAVAVGVLVGCADSGDMVAPEGDFNSLAASKASDVALARTFQVTIENLTSGGQHFTPPLVAISQGSEEFFTPGTPASMGIQQISENGNLGPMLDRLGMTHKVSSFVVAESGEGLEGPLAPGEAVTVDLTAEPGSNFLSFASMLICTNDGFTGVDRAKLPEQVGEEIQLYAGAYDAGTEINTEDFVDLVPPCQVLGGVSSGDEGTGMSDPALAEGGVITPHGGIQGGNDLVPSIHGWSDPVAMITVRRIG